jgi:hypothetical protein
MRRFSIPGRAAPLRHRLERAARDLNPYLVLLVIGLVMLNLTALVLRVPHLGPNWSIHRGPCAPASALQNTPSGADAALRTGS